MKLFLLTLLFVSVSVFSQGHNPAFHLMLNDSGITVTSPDKVIKMFSVVVENNSLSDQVAKFVSGGDVLKFVNITSGKSVTVEIENKGKLPVVFVPVSPAFQEVPLTFGNKQYEIPPKR